MDEWNNKKSQKSLSTNQTTSLKYKNYQQKSLIWYWKEKKNIMIYLWNLIILTPVPKPNGQFWNLSAMIPR